MSRLYINIKNKPKVIIEFSEDIQNVCKPEFDRIFGTAFLSAEVKRDSLLTYEFNASEEDFGAMEKWMEEVNQRHIVKSIDIDINLS